MIVWYKYGYFWRKGDADGDDSPQDRDDGTGDILFNTLSKIEDDGDTSDWAVASFIACTRLLKKRKRWPDEFSKPEDAPNRFVWQIQKLYRDIRYKLTGKWSNYYRSQNDMTRDPYIAYGACYAHLLRNLPNDEKKLLVHLNFLEVRLPWYLYRPRTWRWWRLMIRDKRKHYVKRLSYLRARAVVHYYEEHYADDFYEDTI